MKPILGYEGVYSVTREGAVYRHAAAAGAMSPRSTAAGTWMGGAIPVTQWLYASFNPALQWQATKRECASVGGASILS